MAHPRREPSGPWLGSLPPPCPSPTPAPGALRCLLASPLPGTHMPGGLGICPHVRARAWPQKTHSCGRGDRALNAMHPREHEATRTKYCLPGGALPGLPAPETAHVTSSLLAPALDSQQRSGHLPPPGPWMPPCPHSLRPRGHAASSPLGSPHPPAPPLQPVTLVPHVRCVLPPFLTPSRVWLLPCPPLCLLPAHKQAAHPLAVHSLAVTTHLCPLDRWPCCRHLTTLPQTCLVDPTDLRLPDPAASVLPPRVLSGHLILSVTW